MTRDEALALGRSEGGKAVKAKTPPATCPRCSRQMTGRTWHSYLGHLGLHGLAERHFGGDIQAAQKHLQQNGLARLDPFPGNGAWPKYSPITGHEVPPYGEKED